MWREPRSLLNTNRSGFCWAPPNSGHKNLFLFVCGQPSRWNNAIMPAHSWVCVCDRLYDRCAASSQPLLLLSVYWHITYGQWGGRISENTRYRWRSGGSGSCWTPDVPLPMTSVTFSLHRWDKHGTDSKHACGDQDFSSSLCSRMCFRGRDRVDQFTNARR